MGQLVPCIVLQLDDDDKKEAGKRKIWLSLRLSLLHKGFNLDSFQPGMVCQCLLHFPFIRNVYFLGAFILAFKYVCS